MLRFVVLGTGSFALRCANAISQAAQVVGLVSKPPAGRPDNSVDTEAFAAARHIAYAEFDDINDSAALDWLRSHAPDIIFSAWPNLLKRPVLELPRRFVIGSHPTSLPFNRGRHPLHWMLAIGIGASHISFFVMDEGVDSGPLLHQEPFELSEEDTIGDANTRMEDAAAAGLQVLLKRLAADPDWAGAQQDASRANTWRKRTPADITLDPRLSVEMISRIVRSFATPYPCAILIVRDFVLRVVAAEKVLAEDEAAVARMEHGRIVSAGQNEVVMKVANGLIRLVLAGTWPAELAPVRHIHPPLNYAVQFGGGLLDRLR